MIMEIADESPRAYVPFHPAVKSKQPQCHGYFCMHFKQLKHIPFAKLVQIE